MGNLLPTRYTNQYSILYRLDMDDAKPVEFRGSAQNDLRAFPIGARREVGHQADQVQQGLEPDD